MCLKTRRIVISICLLIVSTLIPGCDLSGEEQKLKGAGLLIPKTINDQVWGTKGYTGLLQIGKQFDVDVYYREDIDTKVLTENAVREFHEMGVNFIIGHGDIYAEYFNEVAGDYPDIHFVSLNGSASEKNTTSLAFKGYAMGYIGGMIAAEMSKNDTIAVIGAYPTQPEVQGFVNGAKYENPSITVHNAFTENWDDADAALRHTEILMNKEIDVIYPAGDSFNVPVIEKAKQEGIYVIGYIADQLDFGEKTVLTSTVQHVDKLLLYTAEQFSEGLLKSGDIYFDFEDDVVSIGRFSPEIPHEYRKEIETYIEIYKQTGELPGEEGKNE